jgi:hypothetical protein
VTSVGFVPNRTSRVASVPEDVKMKEKRRRVKIIIE